MHMNNLSGQKPFCGGGWVAKNIQSLMPLGNHICVSWKCFSYCICRPFYLVFTWNMFEKNVEQAFFGCSYHWKST